MWTDLLEAMFLPPYPDPDPAQRSNTYDVEIKTLNLAVGVNASTSV